MQAAAAAAHAGVPTFSKRSLPFAVTSLSQPPEGGGSFRFDAGFGAVSACTLPATGSQHWISSPG
jgi:hypothetical protein